MRLKRLCLVLALMVTGCGDAATAGEPPHIGFVVKRAQGSFAQEMISGFKAGAARVGGVEVTAEGPSGQDAHKEVELFERLAATAKGGVAAATSEPALIAQSLAKAVQSGVPVITVDMRPAPGARVDLHIGNDNYELGTMLADELLQRLPKEATGKVVVGNTAPGLAGLDARAKGIRDRITRERPHTQVIGPFDTQRDPEANLDAWRRLVAANPDAVAFLGTGDTDGYNLAGIRQQTGAHWLVGGFGVAPQTLQAIRDGRMVATVSPEHYLKGALAGLILARSATGFSDPPTGWLYTPGLAITSANLEDVVRRQESDALRLAWFRAQLDAYAADPAKFLRTFDQAR